MFQISLKPSVKPPNKISGILMSDMEKSFCEAVENFKGSVSIR